MAESLVSESPEDEHKTDTSSPLLFTAQLMRWIIGGLAVLPGLPLLLIICASLTFASSLPDEYLYPFLDLMVFIAGALACVTVPLLPISLVVGIILSRKAKREFDWSIPTLAFVLGGILWLVWVGYSYSIWIGW
jgi:hypothetical protein